MSSNTRFMVVDDDPICNKICKYALNKVVPGATILDFTNPFKAIEYVEENCVDKDYVSPNIMLLDLNMPEMSGWDFLARFDQLPDSVKTNFTIYILTSSVNSSDRERAHANKNVQGYLLKPFGVNQVKEIIEVA